MSNPASICMPIATFHPVGGGVARQAQKIGDGLADRGKRVSVLTRFHRDCPSDETIGALRVHRAPPFPGRDDDSATSYLAGGLLWMIQQRPEFDLLHCHQALSPGILGGLARVMFPEKRAVVKISSCGPLSEAAVIASSPFRKVRTALLRKIDRVVVLNPQMKQEFEELGYPADRIRRIPNGVEIPAQAAFHPRVRDYWKTHLGIDDRQMVLFVGRLSSEKRLDTLLQAWSRLCSEKGFVGKAMLGIVGYGGDYRNVESDVRNEAVSLGITSTVHFFGRKDDVLPFYLASDLFVLPSETEGMSNALLEAMSCGTAIVATQIPGNAVMIRNRCEGLLFPVADVPALTECLGQVLNDVKLRDSLARGARARAEEEFALDRVIDRYLRLYHEVYES